MTFYKRHEGTNMHYRRTMFRLDYDGELESMYYSPPFEGPVVAPANEMGRFYDAYYAFVEEIEKPKYRMEWKMKKGELACFNNRRLVHGRNSFDPQTGARHLQGTYVDLDEFRNRLMVLSEKYGVGRSISRIGCATYGA